MAAYDDYDYPKYWHGRSYEHNAEMVAINHFFSKIKNKTSIIDIGCGHGRLCQEYLRSFKKVTLADPSSNLLKIAKKNCSSEKVKFVCSDVEHLKSKVKEKNFDVALMVRVLHHIEEPKEAFEAVNEKLKKGGYFILEFANKVHGKATIKQFLKGDFTFIHDIFPNDRRSRKNKKGESISFVNHHPDIIENYLKNAGFEIVERRSVSNVRSRRVKRWLPMNILVSIEEKLQENLAKINFGPSIFILAKKKYEC